MRLALALALALALTACGAAAPAPPPARPGPSGPVATYLHVPRAFLLRVDCAAIRATPIAGDVSTLWRGSPLFERLASTASFDPIRDLDAMVTTTSSISSWRGGPVAPRWRVVLRHHEGLAAARALLARIAGERGEPLAWRESQGLVSALLPGELSRETPHAILLSAAHEAVIAPDDERGAILVAARDHAARREADTDIIEPGLVVPEGELVRAETTSPPPVLADLGATAARATVERAGQGAAIHLELDFPSAALAAPVAVVAGAELALIAQNPLVAALGLAHPLSVARVAAVGSMVTADTQATFTELAAALRALALVSGAGP